MSDERLLAAVRGDEPGAFDAFVERYGRRLMAFGMRMCRRPEDAEDVFQDTLIQAYRGLAKLREPGALVTWLFRVAANQCLMKRRKERPEREISLDTYLPPSWERGEPVEIPDWSHLPEDEAARAELHDALERGIGELPPEYRVVILLRDVEGLSTRQAAEALGVGEGAVKMRLHRARLALRDHLAAYHGDGAVS